MDKKHYVSFFNKENMCIVSKLLQWKESNVIETYSPAPDQSESRIILFEMTFLLLLN